MDATQIGTLVVASTGLLTAIAAVYKNRTDSTHKKREQDVATTTALDERHQVIYNTIQNNIVEPLVARVEVLNEDTMDLRQDLIETKQALALAESKHQLAILYARELLAHIDKMTHPSDPPVPPSGLDV